MSAPAQNVVTRPPRRARYLIPPDAHRRAEILAAATLASLLAGVLFAQVTLAAAVACHAFGKVTRLRPTWLLAPAGCGFLWALAIGPGRALAGFWAVPSGVGGLVAHAVTNPAALGRLSGVPGVIGRGIGGQFPAALPLAAGLAGLAAWARWLHTNEWDLTGYRAGLVRRGRLWWTTAVIRSGGVVTREGACLGADLATGGAAAVSWREAAGGVLVTGADQAAVTASAFQLVHAAIRLRTPVLVVDLAGDPTLPGALAAVCAAAGAPLLTFDATGTAHYEPLRGSEPERGAGLVMGIIDWRGVPDQAKVACHDCLMTALALLDAAPGDPGRAEASTASLDELAWMLRPGAMRGRAARIAAWHPGRDVLAGRADAAERWLERDQATAALVAGQLGALRAGGLGRWLSPGAGRGASISVGEVIRQRAVALFSLGTAGSAAGMIANLLALDIATRYADLHAAGTAPDGLAWFNRCDRVAPTAVAALAGTGTGLVGVLSTTSPAAAGGLAGQVGICVTHRLADRELAARLAALTGTRLVPAGQPVAAAPFSPVPQIPAGAGLPLPASPFAPAGEVPSAPRPAAVASHAVPGQDVAAGGPPPFGAMRTFVVPAQTLCDLADGEFVLTVRDGNTGRGVRVTPRAGAVAGRAAATQVPRAPAHRRSR